jgi:hypothetical protein
MKLLNLNKFNIFFFFIFISFTNVYSEDAVDIWKKSEKEKDKTEILKKNNNSNNDQKITLTEKTPEIIENTEDLNVNVQLYGIYDPELYDLNLDMWIKTDGEKIKKTFNRISKIKLSKSAEELFTNVILTYSFSPSQNISEDEFLELKIDWLIENKKDKLLEEFLNKNSKFKNKEKIIQYLVDKNISKANLSDGCKKVEFINKEITDQYLEKFKIYCLIFNNKKDEAQLLFDILREQKLSDNFFDNKINFLLGVNNKTDNKIKDDNLLNFYLSSITIENFNYEPNINTNKFIWEYMNAANLVKIDDIDDKERIKKLEKAAEKNTLNKLKIFEIYKKKSFDINSLVNAEGIYQSLDGIDSRSLVLQKYLLSDNSENKIKLLFLLKDLFKKDNLSNVSKEFLSDEFKKLRDNNEVPDQYKEAVLNNIINDDQKLGKIRYDDKILHRSRLIRFYTEENNNIQKSQKDLNNVYKKIRKNKNYFFSAKDLALVESLEVDGLSIPKEIKHKEISKKYTIPEGLLELMKNKEIGLLSLKFVEIIGEDEIYNLDPETIYFITNILNQAKLIKLRNKVLSSALPFRT